jgi:hypothetical protein
MEEIILSLVRDTRVRFLTTPELRDLEKTSKEMAILRVRIQIAETAQSQIGLRPNYYRTLGIPIGSSLADINAAYDVIKSVKEFVGILLSYRYLYSNDGVG